MQAVRMVLRKNDWMVREKWRESWSEALSDGPRQRDRETREEKAACANGKSISTQGRRWLFGCLSECLWVRETLLASALMHFRTSAALFKMWSFVVQVLDLAAAAAVSAFAGGARGLRRHAKEEVW